MMKRLLMRAMSLGALWACASASALPAVPANWPTPQYRFENNPISEAGFELGRALFYDPLLSRDGSTSCASCHQQASAFAHTRHRVSHGIRDQVGTRNAPALFNLAWQPDFMWDGAVSHFEMQPLAPITNPVEMDQPLPVLLDKLRAHAEYPVRFERAFGSPGIDTQRLLRALAQFTSALVSMNSRYDRAEAGGAPLSSLEQQGLAAFRAHCADCHREPLFSDYSYRNNGLDAQPVDVGRAAISGDPRDTGRFRVPSLRNVALTAPYMHDGRLDTLDAVLDHYARGVRDSATLDSRLKGGLVFEAGDRAALIAFLNTLTDDAFVRNARFAAPGSATSGVMAQNEIGWTRAWSRLLPGRAHAVETQTLTSHENIAVDGARIALSAPPVEAVVIASGGALTIHVDDYLTNTPLGDLDVTVLSGTRALRATAESPGLYRVATDVPLNDAALGLRIRNDRVDLRLDGAWPEAIATPTEPKAVWPAWLVVLIALAATLLWIRKRPRA